MEKSMSNRIHFIATLLVAVLAQFLMCRRAMAADCTPMQQPTNSNESITCATPRQGVAIWRIDRPNVKQAQTTYPSITFSKGDLVSVFSGGCVQTGGSGLTWKRYVKPVARDQSTDNRYFGQISIPGFGGLRPIRDAVLAGGISINQDPGSTPLTLGYVDDDHSDNGYWGRDDGWWEQCRDLTDAFVVVAIQHNCDGPNSSCIHGLAMDKVITRRDPNNFPVNPDWVWTALVGSDPSLGDVCSWSVKTLGFPRDNAELCLTAAIQKDINSTCDAKGATEGRNSGHVNIIDTPITYNASTWLDSVNFPLFEDDDYTFDTLAQNLILAPKPHNQLSHSLWVKDQKQDPQVEFSDSETLGGFNAVPWWSAFDHAAFHQLLSSDSAAAKKFFGNHEVVIVGILGFDCAHSCNTELHPALAFFVHNVEESSNDNDVWEFFVRNSGNEGFCGSQIHFINTTQISVLLQNPYASDVSNLPAKTILATTLSSGFSPKVSVVEDPGKRGAIATFSLPSPDTLGVVYGELHLKWTPKPDPRPQWITQEEIGVLRKQGVSEQEIQRALREDSPFALTRLRDEARARAVSKVKVKQGESQDVEEVIAERVARQSPSFQANARENAKKLDLKHNGLNTEMVSSSIRAALEHLPKGSPGVFSVAVPVDPGVEQFRKQLADLISEEKPSNAHPELTDRVNR